MPDPDPQYTNMMRDTFVEELEEWFYYGYSEHQPPPYFWFIFDDANLGIGDIYDVVLPSPTVDQYDLQRMAESAARSATEQVQNASYEQVACYTKAREAWVESP
ncbi:MAG: hypothetical protein KJO40_13470 [Deltaproteobacteria bacterium]|nr:hypothetical protein [Deltaproteobacteria bacterium]